MGFWCLIYLFFDVCTIKSPRRLLNVQPHGIDVRGELED